MNTTAVWSIIGLLVSTSVTIYTLLSEKKDTEQFAGLRRYRKVVLITAAIMAFLFGTRQTYNSYRVTNDEAKKHFEERQQDRDQIIRLQTSLRDLGEQNALQYKHNHDQLHEIEEQVTKLKLSKLSAEDRAKIEALQLELAQAVAPKPKAKLDLSFYQRGIKTGEIHKTAYAHANGDVFSFSFFVENNSNVNANHVKLWIRICQECKFHTEPPGAIKVPGAEDFERLYTNFDVPVGVSYQKMDVEVEMPSPFNAMPATFDYRCDDCEIEPEWQRLDVNVGRIMPPHFYRPATIPKKPAKH
jgi:hypothetical protein